MTDRDRKVDSHRARNDEQPQTAKTTEDELSDESLDSVAGGICIIPPDGPRRGRFQDSKLGQS